MSYEKEIEKFISSSKPYKIFGTEWYRRPNNVTKKQMEAIKSIHEENKKLKRRLEIDTCLNSKGETIPVENPETFPDKITCLEIEIEHLYEPKIAELKELIAELEKGGESNGFIYDGEEQCDYCEERDAPTTEKDSLKICMNCETQENN